MAITMAVLVLLVDLMVTVLVAHAAANLLGYFLNNLEMAVVQVTAGILMQAVTLPVLASVLTG